MGANEEIDIDAYFARIGYSGSTEATLQTLARLQRLHATTIAFENLDPLLGRPVSLSLPAIAKKLLNDRRGGYCFEQNALLQEVLRSLGFSVSGLAAMVQWNRSVDGPRAHMVLRVMLPEGEYLVDVGFGGLTPTSPLRLEPNVEQPTTLEPFRLVPMDRQFQLQAKIGDRWAPVYLVTLDPVSAHDYAVYNWYTSTHPDVVFTNHLMVARPDDGCRYGLFDNQLSIRHVGGAIEKRMLKTPAELASALRDHFHLRLPDGCEALLERLARQSAP